MMSKAAQWRAGLSPQAVVLADLEARPSITPAVREDMAPGQSPQQQGAGTAVIPLQGIMTQKPWWATDYGGTTLVAALVQAAASDDAVGKIVLDIDSPGGDVQGVPELAEVVRAAQAVKPVTAVVNPLAASAAYWVASQAGEIVMTPSGEAGSIGVFAMHAEFSRMYEEAGVAVNIIRTPEAKADINSVEPLSDAARAYLQSEVARWYGMFVEAVAKGRGVSAADVRGGFGQGRVVGGRNAVRAGLVDRIATLEQVLADGSRRRRRGSGRAEEDAPGVEDTAPGREWWDNRAAEGWIAERG